MKVRADTENLQAYDLYLKARELFIARTDLKESIQLFEKVVELDPNFARGWEGLAAVCTVAESWNVRDRTSTPRLLAAPRSVPWNSTRHFPCPGPRLARSSPGNCRPTGRKPWRCRTAPSRRTRQRDPYLWRSIHWVNLGFFDRALAEQERALAIDPKYQNCERWKALTLLYKGETEQALAAFERGVAADRCRSRGELRLPILQTRESGGRAALAQRARGET